MYGGFFWYNYSISLYNNRRKLFVEIKGLFLDVVNFVCFVYNLCINESFVYFLVVFWFYYYFVFFDFDFGYFVFYF